MARIRQRRPYGQKISKTPSTPRANYWPRLSSHSLPNSQPALTKTKIVFDDDETGQSVLPKLGRSEQLSSSKPTPSRTKQSLTVDKKAASRSENDTNAVRPSDEESVYNSANEDTHGVESLEDIISDLTSQKGKNLTDSNTNKYTVSSKQDQTPGSEVRNLNECQQDDRGRQNLEAADENTPTPSWFTTSSLQKLKDAKTSARKQKKKTGQTVSLATNVLHAYSPPRSSLGNIAVSSATPSMITQQKDIAPALLSLPSTELMQAAQTLGGWKTSNEVLMHSSPPQPSANSNKKSKKRPSALSDATTIEAPKSFGPPPSPPSLRLNSIQKAQKAQKEAEARISDVWGKSVASQVLLIEPFQTFSSKFNAFDFGSSYEDEYPDKTPIGRSAGSEKKDKIIHTETKAQAKKQKLNKQGWDVVLAEAKTQAERLEKRRVEIEKRRVEIEKRRVETEKLVDPIAEPTNQNRTKIDKARKKKSKKPSKDSESEKAREANSKSNKNEQTFNDSKKRKRSDEDSADKQPPKCQKVAKEMVELQESRKEKQRREENRKKKNHCKSAERDDTHAPESNFENYQNDDGPTKESSIGHKAGPRSESSISALADLRNLIPKGVLASAAKALDEAEYSRINRVFAKKKRKELKRIKKCATEPHQAFRQDMDTEDAWRNGHIEKPRTFNDSDDEVVLKAAGNLIRALSQNAVVSACDNAAGGETGWLETSGH